MNKPEYLRVALKQDIDDSKIKELEEMLSDDESKRILNRIKKKERGGTRLFRYYHETRNRVFSR